MIFKKKITFLGLPNFWIQKTTTTKYGSIIYRVDGENPPTLF